MTIRPTRHPAAPSWRWLALIGLALFLILMTARAAAAENLGPGGSRVIVGDEVFGPYRLLVTSAPNPATTGTVTFVVRVSDPASETKVRDAQVEVELTQGTESIKQAATHENAGNPIDYAAHMQIANAGMWNGTIRVTGPAGASEVTFLQQVATPRKASTLLLVAIPFAVMLGVFAAMFVVRTSRQRGEDDGKLGQGAGK
jgi:hypothetical protein